MMKNRILAAIAVFSVVLSGGCIHEFPDETPVDPTLVNASMTFALEFPDLLPFDPSGAVVRSGGEACDMRAIVEVYSEEQEDRPLERRAVNCTSAADAAGKIEMEFALHAAKYKVYVWVDHVDKGGLKDKYYKTNDLTAIAVADGYTGCSDYKNVLVGQTEIDLTGYRDQWNAEVERHIALERPLAKIELITTDVEKFIDKQRDAAVSGAPDLNGFSVKFVYSCYFPVSFNVKTDKPNDAKLGVGFDSRMELLSATEARMGYDYVFVNGAESGVTVDMIVYDGAGNEVTRAAGITVPIKRNGLTTVKGEFLTRDYSPGVGIDPGYDGDIEITIPD